MFARRAYSTVLKQSTGITGLAVVAEPRKVLTKLYEETLEAVEAIPKDAHYRTNVEALTKHRLAIVTAEEDVETIENKIGAGQVEELIATAEAELELIPKMAKWEPWKGETAVGVSIQ